MNYRVHTADPARTRVLVLTPAQLFTTYGVADFGEADDRLVLVLVDDEGHQIWAVDDDGDTRETHRFAARVAQIGRTV